MKVLRYINATLLFSFISIVYATKTNLSYSTLFTSIERSASSSHTWSITHYAPTSMTFSSSASPSLQSIITSISISEPAQTPQRSHSDSKFTPAVIGGIIGGIGVLVIAVFVLGFVLRHHKRKARQRALEDAIASKTYSPIMGNGSLRGIMVTKEVEMESQVSLVRIQDLGVTETGFEKRANS